MSSSTIPALECEKDERLPNEAAKIGGFPPSGSWAKLPTAKSAKPQVTLVEPGYLVNPAKQGSLAR